MSITESMLQKIIIMMQYFYYEFSMSYILNFTVLANFLLNLNYFYYLLKFICFNFYEKFLKNI